MSLPDEQIRAQARATMIEWLERHNACQPGLEWAKAECNSLEDVWAKAKPVWLFWVATRPGVLTKRDRVRLGAGCAERVRHLMTDQSSRDALDVCGRYVQGEATDQELACAENAAYAAESAAASSAAAVAAASAAAAEAAALSAAAVAAASADAADAAAQATACAADAYAAERKWQADFLRREFVPNFGGGQ